MTEMSPAEAVFFAAAALPAADRAAYLVRACAGNDELRRRVEQMLAARPQVGDFLEPPPGQTVAHPAGEPTADHPADATGDYPGGSERVGAVLGGKYKLIEEVGEGGMGSVFMAQQTEPVKRAVAVKVIKAGMDSKAVIARFEAERQALAMMDHPNIARVFDAGTTEGGRPFFVMELVKGTPITQFCDERKLTPRQRLELFVPVCNAIQHAHQKGVIHRDIKPSNVLVALYDDKPVPKMIDFGVAKAAGQALTDKTLATGFGAVVGTPEYMSPEQASFNNLDIDTRSDVYALGVLLYELLTGSPPFSKKELEQVGLLEIYRVIREQEPPRPSTKLSTADALPTLSANRGMEPKRLTALLRGELDWIVLKALEKDRTRRYETANGFVMDIQRYLNGEPVLAAPPSASYRLRKFVRRNKRVLASVAAFAVLLVGATAVSLGFAAWALRAESATHQALEQVTGEQQKTQAALDRETIARNDAQERLRESYFVQAYANRSSGRPGRRFDSLAALTKAAAIPSDGRPSRLELRNEAIASLALTDVSSQPIWEADLPNSKALAMDPDFQHYATWSREEGQLYVRRRSDRAEVARFPVLKDSIWPVVFSPDGRYLAVGSRGDISGRPADGKRHRFDVWDWRARTSVLTDTAVPTSSIDLRFSPDGTRLVVFWGSNPNPVIYDLQGNNPPRAVSSKGVAVAFHPDGTKVAVVDGKTVTTVDIVTGQAVGKPLTAPATIYAANWSHDGQLLAIGCKNFRGYLHDANTGAVRAQLVGHQAEVNRVFFNPAGTLLVSTDWNEITRVWDAHSGRHLVQAHGAALGFSRDGVRLSFVNGTRAGVWQVASGHEFRELTGHTCFKGPGGVRWGLDGSFVASSGDDATRLWNPATGKQIGLLPVGGNSLRLHPDGASWYTGGASGFYRWPIDPAGIGNRLRIGPPEKLREASPTTFNGVNLSSDGRWLVLSDPQRGQVIVRSTTDPKEQKTFGGFVELGGATISPDNRWLVVGGWPHVFLHVYDLTTEQCVHKFSLVTSAWWCFSPDGKWLAVANAEGGSIVKVGAWTTHREIPPRNGSPGVGTVAFSRDGTILALNRQDHIIQLFDVDSLTELAALEAPAPTFSSLIEFSPDDSRLAIACSTRVVHLWDLRAIRGGLAQLGLDWDAPPYRDAAPTALAPPAFDVIATGLADPAALQRGLALNNQAWQLLAGPPDRRDAAKGLALIQQAVKLRPNDATLLNTLGVGQYRNAKYREAVATFEKSLAAGKGQWDGFDLFFLAMSHAKLDDAAKARECFDRAVRWVEQRTTPTSEHVAELKAFRAEAELLLR